MEKNANIWQKVLAISFIVVSFLFVLLLMLFMFNSTIGENFVTEVQENAVVRTIVIVMSVIYFINAIVLGIVTFYTKGTLDAITIQNADNSCTKITRGSIISVVKHNTKFVEGIQVKGVNILQDAKGGLNLSVVIRVVSVPVEEVVTPFRVILYNAFKESMGVEFASIDFIVTALKPKYTPDMDAVEAQTNALRAKRDRLSATRANMQRVEDQQEQDQAAVEARSRHEEIERARTDEDSEPVTEVVEVSAEETVSVDEPVATEEVVEEDIVTEEPQEVAETQVVEQATVATEEPVETEVAEEATEVIVEEATEIAQEEPGEVTDEVLDEVLVEAEEPLEDAPEVVDAAESADANDADADDDK